MTLRVSIEYLGDSIELPYGETIVGRDVGCMLRFNDPSVSRRHLRFIHRHDEVFVEDLGSSNGTLLNDRAVIAPVRIRDGDTVEIGGRVLTLKVSDAVEAADVPTTLDLEISPAEQRVLRRAAKTQMVPTIPPPIAALEAQPIDRRGHDRRAADLPIIYTSSSLEVEATTRDLSKSGVFVRSQVLDPVGTRCQLTILLDGGPPLSIEGVVARVVEHDATTDRAGIAVAFTDVGAKEQAWLDTFATS